ncbi:hypothetical protein PYW07_012487 [Mythimna separata]|uniref:PAP-associated domain-containing protein n=1 Tax=Mythimna separata TaxID=271217 RepID=A0AAD7YMW7_MYTSE|nr:hypothetical protein PYW07_012487 [Mythimna separata]
MSPQNIYFPLVCGVAVLVLCGSGVLSLAGDFDSQLQKILQEQTLSPQDPVITQVLDDVRATLDQRWQGYDLILCGSLAVGLGTLASDIDLVVKLPNFNSSAGSYVLEEIKTLFTKQPELYSTLAYGRTNVSSLSTFFTFNHIPTARKTEIEFNKIGDLAIENNKIIKYYFDLDKRYKYLCIFLKYWSKIHEVTGHKRGDLPGYALYLMIIFYLQQKDMAPPAYVLQANSTPYFNDGWNLGFDELPYKTTNTENLHQLLGGFFKYYSEFNFEENFVSPFAGRPIPKNAFTDINNFPKEYTLYNNTLNRTMKLAVKNDLDAEVSVQDVFMHDLNDADPISHEQAMDFKHLIKSMATMFDELPSDQVLKAILDTEKYKY